MGVDRHGDVGLARGRDGLLGLLGDELLLLDVGGRDLGLLQPLDQLDVVQDVPLRAWRVQGSGFRVPRCRIQGSGFRVQGSGFRVQGSGCWVNPSASPAISRGSI